MSETLQGLQMEIVDYGTCVNEARASVCMSFEAWTSVHMSFKTKACIKTTYCHIFYC